MSAFRQFAEENRLSPVEIDGRWYWIHGITPSLLWWELDEYSYDTEDAAWTAISEVFDRVVKQFSPTTIDRCAAAIDAYADALEDESKQKPYRVAAMIVRRLKPSD